MSPLPEISGTPTPLPPPPRRTTLRPVGTGLRGVRLFLLPHTLIGLGGIGWFLLQLAWLLAGTNTAAQVTHIVPHNDAKGETYELTFVYQVAGQLLTGHDTIEASLNPGAVLDALRREVAPATVPARTSIHLTVRHVGIGSLQYVGLPPSTSAWTLLLLIGGFLVVWWSFLSMYLWRAWGVPWKARRLVQRGTAVTGWIDRKRPGEKGTVNEINYHFIHPTTGKTIKTSLSTYLQAYDFVHVGDGVTVLFEPGNSKRSTVYELSRYQVDGAGERQPLRTAAKEVTK